MIVQKACLLPQKSSKHAKEKVAKHTHKGNKEGDKRLQISREWLRDKNTEAVKTYLGHRLFAATTANAYPIDNISLFCLIT